MEMAVSLHIEIGRCLSEARGEANLTQKQVAESLGVHQSRISRLEQGEGADWSEYHRYLEIVGTAEAQRLSQVLSVEWKHLPRPSLRHPDLGVLIDTECALERLDSFRQGQSIPQVLAGQADLLFRRLQGFGDFLLRLDHRITYVGEIGVGKTTAACRQAGLVLDAGTAHDLRGMLLDTGGGRTTLCDVLVRTGERFALQVDPVPDEEVYRYVAELCRAIMERKDGEAVGASAVDYRPAEEIERALRNMADLLRPTRRKGGPPIVDPAATLASSFEKLEDFQAEFASRLTLWRRTRRSILFEGADLQAGRRWLRDTFTQINNGRHADFSLPGRIVLTVPFDVVPGTPFEISLTDTRGVDGSAIRPDIVAQLKERRALSVLCSKWGSAPDPSLQELLKHVADTEVDPALLTRVVVLVLARAGDALSMRHDSGESAADIDDGYEIKKAHVEDALQRIDLLGVDVTVFDATGDDPGELTAFLGGKIATLRGAQANAARQTIDAVDQMLRNVEKAQALAALAAIGNELTIFADRHARLREGRRPVHSRLLEAIRTRHPRTVWATTRRAGTFWNFDVYQHLGDGASAEAKRRAGQVIAGLREIIANKLADPEMESSHGFLGQLLDDIDRWESDFVRAARHHAVSVFRPVLADAADLWGRCEGMYGARAPYRVAVADEIGAWFEAREELQDEVDRRVQRGWWTSVLEPLRTAAGGTEVTREAGSDLGSASPASTSS